MAGFRAQQQGSRRRGGTALEPVPWICRGRGAIAVEHLQWRCSEAEDRRAPVSPVV